MTSLSTLVPTNYVLTSGVNSAMTWSNVLTLSTANCSTVNTSSIVTNSIGANVVTLNSTLSVSTLTARTVNYSSITGSSISTNAMTLSLTNVSTQNTQIYQVATTNPTTSYTAIQASHVSTGTTNNALALNPSGGNVGMGETNPLTALHIKSSTADPASSVDTSGATGHILLRNTKTGVSPYSMAIGVDQTTGAGYINAAGNGAVQSVCLNTRGGYVGIGRIDPPCPLYLNGGAGTTGWAGQTYIGNTTRGVILGVFDNKVQVGGHAADLGAWAPLYINNGGSTIVGAPGTTFQVSSFTTTGTVTAGANGLLSVSSDYRVKENIQYVTDTTAALSSVMALKPATYRMIGDQGERLGFIAQDVEKAIPLAVDGKKYEWLWESQADGSPLLDSAGQFVWKLDADGNKIIRPRGLSDVSIVATQTLAIQELASKLTSTQQQLAAKSASLDAIIAWAQTMGYSASV